MTKKLSVVKAAGAPMPPELTDKQLLDLFTVSTRPKELNQKNSILQLFRIKKPSKRQYNSFVGPPQTLFDTGNEISKTDLVVQEPDEQLSPNQRTYHDLVAEALELMERDPKTTIDIQNGLENNKPVPDKAGIDRLLRRQNPFKPVAQSEVDHAVKLARRANTKTPSKSPAKIEYPFETNTWNQPISRMTQRSSSLDNRRVRYYIVKKFKPHQTNLITAPDPANATPNNPQEQGTQSRRAGPSVASEPSKHTTQSSSRQKQANLRRIKKMRKSDLNDQTV